MSIDINLILNFLIAIFIYNIILKAIGAVILKEFFKSDEMKEQKKSFKEKLKDKLNKEKL